MVRRHIVFHGSVQGVGFRFRAGHAADLYRCTGWVRNEWDGTVSMEIQGTEDAIDKVIMALKDGIYIHIDSMEVETIPVDESERSFRVR